MNWRLGAHLRFQASSFKVAGISVFKLRVSKNIIIDYGDSLLPDVPLSNHHDTMSNSTVHKWIHLERPGGMISKALATYKTESLSKFARYF